MKEKKYYESPTSERIKLSPKYHLLLGSITRNDSDIENFTFEEEQEMP